MNKRGAGQEQEARTIFNSGIQYLTTDPHVGPPHNLLLPTPTLHVLYTVYSVCPEKCCIT